MNENNLILSIIIPIYNAEKTLKRCIKSLVEQFFPQNITLFEIICIDDGSNDKSWDILQEYAKEYPKTIRIFKKENGGPSSARNYALQKAAGEYLSFIDSDDYVTNQYLHLIITTLKQQPDIDILEIGTNSISPKGKLPLIVNHSKLSFKENFVYQCKYFLFARVISHKICENIQFDENIHLCEDALFLTACYNKASIFFRVEENIYNYAENLNSITHTKTVQQLQNLSYIINKSKENLLVDDTSNLLYLGLMGNMLFFRRGLKVILTKQVYMSREDKEDLKIFYKFKKRYEQFDRKLPLRLKLFIGLKFPNLTNIYTLFRHG